MPDQITLAGDELRHGATRMALRILDDDPGDEVARALGSLGRALFGPQH